MSFAAGAGTTNVDLIYAGLEALPAEGREAHARDFSIRLGGGVVATMGNLARLGVPARAGTYLGEDLFSSFAAAEMERLGIKVERLPHEGGIPLSVTTVALTPADRTFLSYIDWPENGPEVQEQVYRLCTGARVVEMQPGYLPAYRRLKAEGATLVLDLGWDDDMSFEKYREYLELADYFTPNRDEAMKMTETATPEEAAYELLRYFEKVIVKLDSEGCLVLENGKLHLVKSIPKFTRVDSTGAGDAFLAGLMYGLYQGSSLRQAVLYGNITGGNCVAHIGCLTAPLSEAELLALAEEYQGYIE